MLCFQEKTQIFTKSNCVNFVLFGSGSVIGTTFCCLMYCIFEVHCVYCVCKLAGLLKERIRCSAEKFGKSERIRPFVLYPRNVF